MESGTIAVAVKPPWGTTEFFSEEGLRSAQEYYFQTHATHSRMIAEGRNAQGLSKSFVRRKLTREMGEDFKMYTGTIIGQEVGEKMDSMGIRGEMNSMLGHIYRKVAPGQPITSPAQEDSAILSHPHGGIESCFAMVCFYKSLLSKYASLAANRRKVLKSIMDEELFKWVWRTVIGFMMAPEEQKISLEVSTLSSGLPYIPQDLQRAPLGQKLHEIGMFLLSKNMQDSELREVLCHYFVIYLRQFQTLLLMRTPRKEVEILYHSITRHGEGDLIEHPLVAADRLMNDKGSSMESFEEILKKGTQIAKMIPAPEAEFINQFEDFSNPKRLATTLRKLIPDPRKEPEDEQHSTLMPLMLMLRTMPVEIAEVLLAKLPVPVLNMIRNRVINTTVDDAGKELVERIRSVLEIRKNQGVKYNLASRKQDQDAAPAASVRLSQHSAEEVAGSSAAPTIAKTPGTAEAPPSAAAVERPGKSPSPAGEILDERTLLAWKVDGGSITGVSISAREVMALTGNELRFVLPWVVFTLRTGQVFGIALDAITKETVETLVSDLRAQFTDQANGKLSPDALGQIATAGKGAPMSQMLLGLARAGGLKHFLVIPTELKNSLDSLIEKSGAEMEGFLRQPAADEYRELRAKLNAKEKEALTLLHRVARTR